MNPLSNSSPTTVFSEEVHASASWALIIALLPCTALLIVWLTARSRGVPPVGLLVIPLTVIPLTLAGAAMAWSGFHYLFSPAGVEIRTLGFRLRWIPAVDIRNYSIDSWSVLGGYGIRGIGPRKAYIWGNRGVRIVTDTGWVFLGHDDPERVIRDLDLITKHPSSALRAGAGHEVTRRF